MTNKLLTGILTTGLYLAATFSLNAQDNSDSTNKKIFTQIEIMDENRDGTPDNYRIWQYDQKVELEDNDFDGGFDRYEFEKQIPNGSSSKSSRISDELSSKLSNKNYSLGRAQGYLEQSLFDASTDYVNDQNALRAVSLIDSIIKNNGMLEKTAKVEKLEEKLGGSSDWYEITSFKFQFSPELDVQFRWLGSDKYAISEDTTYKKVEGISLAYDDGFPAPMNISALKPKDDWVMLFGGAGYYEGHFDDEKYFILTCATEQPCFAFVVDKEDAEKFQEEFWDLIDNVNEVGSERAYYKYEKSGED